MGGIEDKLSIGPRTELARVLSTYMSDDFIGSLSHVVGLARLLEEDSDSFSPRESGTLIRLQAERMLSMAEGLVMAERARDGQLELRLNPVPIRPTIEMIIEQLKPMTQRYSTSLKLIRQSQPRPIHSDITILPTAIRSCLEGIIRSTAAAIIKIKLISRQDRLFVHIIDKDVATADTPIPLVKNTLNHTATIPAFYVARTLTEHIDGEFRVHSQHSNRHIDIILPHTIQLNLELSGG